jgi:hypothetical protein
MKKIVLTAIFLLSINSYGGDVTSTISTLFIQPALSNIGGYNGYVFVTMADGSHFYIGPTEITYELEFSMLLVAKSKGMPISVGEAIGSKSPAGTSITIGSITYYQLYFMQL